MHNYLTDIDLNQNELRNAVFHNSKEAPVDPKIGQFYVDTSEDDPKLVWWNGREWVVLSGSTSPEKIPEVLSPYITISIEDVDTSGMEVGTTIPINYTTKFYPGSYSYGPETGVVVSSLKVYSTNNPDDVLTEPSGTFEGVIVGDNTDYNITVEASHTAGTIPVTDKGSLYPESQILEGTVSASTGSIIGYRKYFYGTNLTVKEINSETIRGLTHSSNPIGTGVSFDLPIQEGTNQVIIAFPTNSGLSLTSVIDTGLFGMEVYDIFSKEIVEVEGANGYNPIDYDVYVYNPEASLVKNKYEVTISEQGSDI